MPTKREPSIRDTIYNAILEGIFSCEYETGQVLNERELMERYQCSKSPVREALVTLCTENVLRNIPRYGYEIVRITQEDASEMMQMRYFIEGGMLRLKFNTLTKLQLAKLWELTQVCSQAQDVWGHWESNVAFHLQLMAFYRNDCCYQELKRILARLKCAYAQFYWSKWDATAIPMDTRFHTDFLQAIEAGDCDLALELLKQDLCDFGNINCDIQNVFLAH